LIHLHPSKLKTDVLYEETVLHPAPCLRIPLKMTGCSAGT
jgi:hypothetical protein